MITALLALALGLARADAPGGDLPALQQAAEAELARAMTGMHLADQPPPYLINYEILDGDVATASASFGALRDSDHDPHRTLRAEVRVGGPELDSSNFDGAFGTRDGVTMRTLPPEDVVTALRREIWLATDEAYKGATEQYAAKLAAREGDERTFQPDLSPAPPLVTAPVARPTADSARIDAIVTRLSALAGEPDEVEAAEAIARDWQGVRFIASSEGTRAWLPTGFAVVRVVAEARAVDGAALHDARWWVARDAASLPPLEVMEAEVREMTAWLVALRDAPVEEDYLGPVLFDDPAAVELFRQLVAPEISGSPPPQAGRDLFGGLGESVPTARIGRRLLPLGWTVVDDPAGNIGEVGGYTYDFEGVEARAVTVVRDGVVRDLLMSRVPRKELGASTGHGRSLGLNRRAAMPAVVEVTPAKAASDRKLERRALALARQAGSPYALVVSRLEPPALTEDFNVAFTGDGPLPGLTAPLEAWRLYADGRREPVRGLSFVGVDRRVLRDVAAAGRSAGPVGVLDASPDRRRFNIGPVGGLPATWTVPPVVISELELRGQTGGEPRAIPPPTP